MAETDLDLLKEQHREVEDLFRKLKDAKGGERIRLLGQLAESLTLHTALEERFFYPALKEYGLADVADQSEREHVEVRRLMSDLMDLKRNDPRLDEVVAKLEQSVLSHVRKEEEEVFPRAAEKIERSALEHAANAMRNAMASLEEKDLLEAADEERVPAP